MRTRVVSWKLAAEMKLSEVSAALVSPKQNAEGHRRPRVDGLKGEAQDESSDEEQ